MPTSLGKFVGITTSSTEVGSADAGGTPLSAIVENTTVVDDGDTILVPTFDRGAKHCPGAKMAAKDATVVAIESFIIIIVILFCRNTRYGDGEMMWYTKMGSLVAYDSSFFSWKTEFREKRLKWIVFH